MSRIRSVHPGLFTDRVFARLSADAALFLIGLWTEADDQGIFRWEPFELRLRLRAGKDGDTEPLLEELEAGNCIRSYEIRGHKYGAIRNFRKFQRPKSPSATHPITDKWRRYVGLLQPISEMDGDNHTPPTPNGETEEHQPSSFPQNGEISPQMEDGGCRMKEGVEEATASSLARGRAKPSDQQQKPPEGRAKPPDHPIRQGAGPVPADWQPNETHRQQVMILGFDDAWMRDQANRYRDHRLETGRLVEDPDAGFRNWLRRAKGFEPSKPNGAGRPRNGAAPEPTDRQLYIDRYGKPPEQDEVIAKIEAVWGPIPPKQRDHAAMDDYSFALHWRRYCETGHWHGECDPPAPRPHRLQEAIT